MKTLIRPPSLLLIATFLVVTLAAGFTFTNNGLSLAHAATSAPTITVSPHTVHPNQKITVTGQGFAPNDTISVWLDQQGNFLGSLTCDGNGNCSGSMIMPLDGPQGQHMIFAQGSQANAPVVNAPIIINPMVLIDTSQGDINHGGPGTRTAITGRAFQVNETVSIYWGSATGTLLGTATTDSSSGFFYFPFVTPTHVAPSRYIITVVRSGQKPATLATAFTVVPPALTVAGGIRSGQTLRFHLSGFQGNENVAISWNANGGQQIQTIRVNRAGSFASPNDQFIFAPSAPLGSYTLTFTGSSSGLQLTAPLNVGPGIGTNAPVNGGGTITVSGGGFSFGETLSVFVEGQKTTTSVSATTAADGSFQANITAPLNLVPNPLYHIVAINSLGSEKATAVFTILSPAIRWDNADPNIQGTTAPYGSAGIISGQNFPVNEQVTLYWNYQQVGQVKLGTAQAAADGSFSFSLTTPSSPFTDNVNIEAIASTNTFTAITLVQPQIGVVLNPAQVLVGQPVSVSAGSFSANTPLTIQLGVGDQAIPLGTATSGSDGSFTSSVTIPANSQGGSFVISVADGILFIYTPLIIDVPLTITPTTGSSGTSIAVQSPNFSGNGNTLTCDLDKPYIAWYDPTTGTSRSLASACTFPETVTAPTNLVSGRTYEVQLIVAGSIIGQASFTAQ